MSWVLLHLWSKTKIRMTTTFQRTSSIVCAGRWRPKKSSMNRASILVHRCDDVCDFRVQCRHNTQASWNPCKYWRYWRDAKLRLPHKCSGFWVQYYNALQSERPDYLGVFFINALRFWLDHRFEYDYKSKKKRRFGLCIRIASGHPEWVWNDK